MDDRVKIEIASWVLAAIFLFILITAASVCK